MWKRAAFAILIVGGLLAALIYSQVRTPALMVSGFIEADEIRLGSLVGGRVLAVLVEEGQGVAEGEELVRLEPYDLIERQQQAAAGLAERQADVDRLSSGFRVEERAQAKAKYDQLAANLQLLKNGPREQEIDAARGRMNAADAELALAEQNFERASQLLESRAMSREEYDAAQEKLKSAQFNYQVRQKELELLELGTRAEAIAEAEAKLAEAKAAWELAKSGYRVEELRRAEAARDAAQADLEATGRQLDELAIRSPAGGVVEALELQAGDLVAARAPVMSILDGRRLWVRAYVPENQLDLRLGDKLPVTVDSYPGEQFMGELSFIARQAEFTPSNVQTPEERSKQVFRIKVELNEGLDRLRPGMAADVWLDQKQPN